MTKITDQNYFLPTIQALSGDKLFGTGATMPMLIRGVCTTTGEKSDYVAKYKSSPRMSIEASSRELIAAFIAKELELHIAEPVIINVTHEFVETLVGKDGYKEWVTSQVNEIQTNLELIVENRNHFLEQLYKSLS